MGKQYAGDQRSAVLAALSKVYRNILAEFTVSGLPQLRLLPVSGGIFSGEYGQQLPTLTVEALRVGFRQLDRKMRVRVMTASSLELCIFLETDYIVYSDAMALVTA